jgi:hypothetical protein
LVCPVIARRLRIGLGSSFWRRDVVVIRFVLFRRVVLDEFHSGTVEHAGTGPGRRVRRCECNRKAASKRRHEGKFTHLPLPLFAIRNAEHHKYDPLTTLTGMNQTTPGVMALKLLFPNSSTEI